MLPGVKRIHTKVIACGEWYEVIYSEEGWLKGFTRDVSDGSLRVEEDDDEDEELARFRGEWSARRSRNAIRRLINSNPDLCSHWVLTFADNVQDIRKANKAWDVFVKRLRRWARGRVNPLRWVKVIEFQARGAVHFHVLVNVPWIDWDELQRLWGEGFVKPGWVYQPDNVGAYMTKYISKAIEEKDGRYFKLRVYSHSQSCKKPQISEGGKELYASMSKGGGELIHEGEWEENGRRFKYRQVRRICSGPGD